jgi:hypothetical protein
MIPIPTLKRIIELLEYWDVSRYDQSIRVDHDDVLRDLNFKLEKLDLRNAYTRVIVADNEDDRDDARINYLRRKRLLNDLYND